MSKSKQKKWDKNLSPVGWYVAAIVQRFEFYDEDKNNLNRLTCLLPVYEELGDGAEIMWSTHQNQAVKKIKALVKSKKELAVFRKEKH